MIDSNRFSNFPEASRSVLEFLRRRHDLDLWMIARKHGDDWIVLHTEQNPYNISAGMVFRRSDILCARLINDPVAKVFPRMLDDAGCGDPPTVDGIGVGAYIGAPLLAGDGRLFGTLCAIDRNERPELGEQDLALLELLAVLLSSLLKIELDAIETDRLAERFRYDAMTDSLTGLPNRRAWDERLETEQARLDGAGGSAFVSVIDLDELKAINDSKGHQAGDCLLQKAALTIRGAVRDLDFVARVGGDEFGVLGAGCGSIEPQHVTLRIVSALERAGIRASVGTAMRSVTSSLIETWRMADRAMYRAKHSSEAPDSDRRAGNVHELDPPRQLRS